MPDKELLSTIIAPFRQFIRSESSSGVLLLISTVVALVWANSPWAEVYFDFWQTQISIGVGEQEFAKPLLLWVNDGLMAIFFFVVGLEIKREIIGGELATLKDASLPIFAALGGMIVPLVMFLWLQGDQPGAEAWGVPMATDIAFSLGILALLGKRVPLGMKVFLTAFAIIDDLGAILVIA